MYFKLANVMSINMIIITVSMEISNFGDIPLERFQTV